MPLPLIGAVAARIGAGAAARGAAGSTLSQRLFSEANTASTVSQVSQAIGQRPYQPKTSSAPQTSSRPIGQLPNG